MDEHMKEGLRLHLHTTLDGLDEAGISVEEAVKDGIVDVNDVTALNQVNGKRVGVSSCKPKLYDRKAACPSCRGTELWSAGGNHISYYYRCKKCDPHKSGRTFKVPRPPPKYIFFRYIGSQMKAVRD